VPRAAALPPTEVPVPARPAAATPARARDGAAGPPPRRRVNAAENVTRRREARRRRAGGWLRALLNNTPAWLVSLVFHLVLLTLLALIGFPRDEGKAIVLNATVSHELRRPGQGEIENPADVIKFDTPVPEELNLQDRQTREAILKADQEARELRMVEDFDPDLPELEDVKQLIGNPEGTTVAVMARDPRVRLELLKIEGGTTLTEAAVARGLRWLAGQQQAEGCWRLDGGLRSNSAATSLALLPYLGAGQTHLTGRHKATVAKGVRWLVEHQGQDGDLRIDSSGNSGMYAHGQGAIVLSEAYLMTGDDVLRQPAQKAIDFIVAAQYRDGGWRYRPASETPPHEQVSDTSVVGWQLMALQSARAAKLKVPPETFELAGHYLDKAQSHDGARYAYQPRNRPTHVMTAEALLCRIYLGWDRSYPALLDGIRWLADEHLPAESEPNIYYWYYGTQAFHHVGGEEWDRWNRQMRDVLVAMQDKEGPHAGSWAPRGEHASAGGRVYMTSLAVCSLEVYYRHLPIFRQIDLERPAAPPQPK
jgi:hypothetical protein